MRGGSPCVVIAEGPTPWGNTPIVKLWDAKGRFVRSFGRSDPARDGEVSGGSLSWSPRGDRIAFAVDGLILRRRRASASRPTPEATLTVWDLDGKELFHLDEKGVGFGNVSLGPDGGRVAAVRARGTLKLPTVDPGQYRGENLGHHDRAAHDDDPRLHGCGPGSPGPAAGGIRAVARSIVACLSCGMPRRGRSSLAWNCLTPAVCPTRRALRLARTASGWRPRSSSAARSLPRKRPGWASLSGTLSPASSAN